MMAKAVELVVSDPGPRDYTYGLHLTG
jgi:hypothetical protein